MSEYYNIQDSMYITTGSKIGIGITNPDQKFEVAGQIDTTNNYSINGTTVLSSTTLGSAVINSSLTTNTGDLTNDGAFNLTTGNQFNINSTNVLNATTLGSSVISSSLKNLGTQNANLNMGSNNITNAADIAFTSATMGGHIIPDTNDAYDIGSAEYKVRDLYVSDNSMWIGDEHKIAISGGKMKFRKRKKASVPAAITAAGGTESGAVSHSGEINISAMKLKHWKAYMRTLANNSNSTIQDIFTDNAEDYIEDSGGNNWLESGTKTFLTSGNVGIGTQDPAALLSLHFDPEASAGLKELLRLSWHDANYDTLKGDGTKISFHTSDTNNYPGTVEAGYFGVMKANAEEANTEADITIANNDGTNMVERIRILADGKVGVGDFSSSSPGYKLDVVGDINFTGSLYQNGSAFSSGEMNIWSEASSIATYDGSAILNGTGSVVFQTKCNGTLGFQFLQINGVSNLYFSATDPGSSNYMIYTENSVNFGSDIDWVTMLAGRMQIQDLHVQEGTIHLTSTTSGGSTTSNGTFLGLETYGGEAHFHIKNKENSSNIFSTNDTERMRIDSSGNVGIGTNDPDDKLHIYENANDSIQLKIVNDYADSRAGISLINDGGTFNIQAHSGRGIMENFGTSGTFFYQKGTGNYYFKTTDSNTTRLSILTDGNVGIGNENPDALLHLGDVENTKKLLYFHTERPWHVIQGGSGSGSSLDWMSSNGGKRFRIIDVNTGNIVFTAQPNTTASSQRVYLCEDGGNVGIGNISPGELLDVRTSTTTINQGARLGEMFCGTWASTAYAQIAHQNVKDTSTSYALIQKNDGETFINSASGKTLHFRNANSEKMTILSSGNVGIGTSSPGGKLHVNGSLVLPYTHEQGIFFRSGFVTSNKYNVSIMAYHHTSSSPDGLSINGFDGISFCTGSNSRNERMRVHEGGAVTMGSYLKIGTNGVDAGAHGDLGNGRRNLFITSTYGGNASSNHGWWIGGQNQSLTSSDNDLYFEVVRNGVSNSAAHIQDNNNDVLMNFTGQHRCNLESTYQESLVGLIVECTGEYYNLDKGISPTINDSIPKVKLTTNENSKAILGVISCEEDDENKRTFGGNFVSIYQNTDGIKRTFINSLGEGGVWVCSSNGNLEIGDTITSSNIAGYGMKQSDDLMHNYTVAKATMNCNFSTIEAESHILKRRPKVNIIVSEYERQITEEVEEEYTKIVKENGIYVKKKLSKTYTRDMTEEVDVYDENHQLIGQEIIPKIEILQSEKEKVVKDSSGNIIWENITDEQGSPVYEDIYQIRYLKSDGTILNKSQYDSMASSGQAYKAVFVGCTYHCG
jgi:hypothetical protein